MRNHAGKYYDCIDSVKKWIWILLFISITFELIFFPAWENFIGCLTFIYAWLLINRFVLKRKYLVSGLMLPVLSISGLVFMYFFLPLPMTLLEGKPLTFNFEVPYTTWINQILFITSVVIAFLMCKSLYRPYCWLNSLWGKMGYFKSPTDTQLWLFGILGVGALFVQLFIQGEDSEEAVQNMGFMVQFIGFMKSYSVFPIFLMMPVLYKFQSDIKLFSWNHKVVIYIVFLILIGIATTRRSIMFQPIVAIAFPYVLLLIMNNKILINTKRSLLIIIGVYLLTGPVSNIAMAMILNRQISYEQNASRTMESVLELYSDKEKMHYLFQSQLMEYDNKGKNEDGWSEYYVDNILLDRFCNVRVIDATIFHAQNIGLGNSMMMKEYFRDYFINLVPSFLLGSVKKNYDITSPGDVLSSESLRRSSLYTGYRVAGDTGVGLSLWGYAFYLINTFVVFVFLYFLASLVKVDAKTKKLIIPIPVLASLMSYFMFFGNSYGIFKYFRFVLRDGWEAILVYCIMFFIIRQVASFLKKG